MSNLHVAFLVHQYHHRYFQQHQADNLFSFFHDDQGWYYRLDVLMVHYFDLSHKNMMRILQPVLNMITISIPLVFLAWWIVITWIRTTNSSHYLLATWHRRERWLKSSKQYIHLINTDNHVSVFTAYYGIYISIMCQYSMHIVVKLIYTLLSALH